MSRRRGAALGLFLLLAAARNFAFWRFFLPRLASLPGNWLLEILRADLGPLLGADLLALTAWGLGLRVLRLWGRDLAEDQLRHGYAFALGLALLAEAVFLLGLAGALHPAALAALGAAAAVLGWPEAARARRLPRVQFAPRSPLETLAAAVLAYCAWHAVILALAPPTDWDVLAYHLALPKLYARAGGISELAWQLHSHWPHLIECLYTAALAFGSDTVPALLHAASCAVLIACVWAAGRREGLGTGAAGAAAALLAAQPVALRLAGTAHSDGPLALFCFLSATAVWSYAREGRRSALVLGGLLGGLAASAKLSGLIPAAGLALWLLGRRPWRDWKARAADVGLYFGLVLAVAAPWYLKTWVWAGNPVWPFFSAVFGGSWSAAAVAAGVLRSNTWTWPPDLDVAVWRYGPQYLLAPLAALALLRRRGARPPPFLPFLWLISLPTAVSVWRNNEAWRFLFPHFPALALTAGWLAEQAWESGGFKRWAAAAAVAAGLLPAAAVTQNNQLFAVLAAPSRLEAGRDPKTLYLQRSLDHYSFYEKVNAALPAGAKVLLFREVRGYYLDCDYQWGDPVDQGLLRYERLASPEELFSALRGLGVTHVLVNAGLGMYGPGSGYYDDRTLALMAAALARHSRTVLAEGAFTLQALEKTPGGY